MKSIAHGWDKIQKAEGAFSHRDVKPRLPFCESQWQGGSDITIKAESVALAGDEVKVLRMNCFFMGARLDASYFLLRFQRSCDKLKTERCRRILAIRKNGS